MQFEHKTLAQHVSFSVGNGPRDLAAAVHRTGATRAFLIVSQSSAGWAETATARLPIAGRFSEVIVHVPADLADRARAAAVRVGADLVIAVGGGSAIGLAKAVALTNDLPIVAVPSTYAGSEVTAVWGLTETASSGPASTAACCQSKWSTRPNSPRPFPRSCRPSPR
jgi:alcohol dehydrogenase class IV